MKLSIKILVTLILAWLTLLIISGLTFKNIYSKLDKYDPFYNYKKVKNLSFNHLKVIGTRFTPGLVKVIKSDSIVLNINNNVIDRVYHEIKGDTLVLLFKDHNKKDILWNENFLVLQTPLLGSVTGQLTSIYIDSLVQNSLKINALKYTNINFASQGIKELELNLDTSTRFDLNAIKKFKMNSLKVNAGPSTELGLGTLYANNIDFKLDSSTVIELNYEMLKKLKK
jgi:hypothetical protein